MKVDIYWLLAFVVLMLIFISGSIFYNVGYQKGYTHGTRQVYCESKGGSYNSLGQCVRIVQ